MIVLDASAVVDLLLDHEPYASQVADHLRRAAGSAAPHLLDAEVGQVLRRFLASQAISEARARQALEDLRQLPVTRHPHGPFLDRALAFRHHVTFCDALYLALSEGLDATLVTRDAALEKVKGCRASIAVLQ